MLELPSRILDDIISNVTDAMPDEACGVIHGRAGHPTAVHAVRNLAASPTACEMDAEQLRSLERVRSDSGEQLFAIYHSRLHSGAFPTAADIRGAMWHSCDADGQSADLDLGAYQIIVSLVAEPPVVRAFRIGRGGAVEAVPLTSPAPHWVVFPDSADPVDYMKEEQPETGPNRELLLPLDSVADWLRRGAADRLRTIGLALSASSMPIALHFLAGWNAPLLLLSYLPLSLTGVFPADGWRRVRAGSLACLALLSLLLVWLDYSWVGYVIFGPLAFFFSGTVIGLSRRSYRVSRGWELSRPSSVLPTDRRGP